MNIKNKLVRFYLLGVLLVSSSEDLKSNHTDDYIKEKSYFYLGDDISEETINHIIEWYNLTLYSNETLLFTLNEIGNDEILKFNDDPYLIDGRIIGLHKLLSEKIISESWVVNFFKNYKYKFRELRLYEIKNKKNNVN